MKRLDYKYYIGSTWKVYDWDDVVYVVVANSSIGYTIGWKTPGGDFFTETYDHDIVGFIPWVAPTEPETPPDFIRRIGVNKNGLHMGWDPTNPFYDDSYYDDKCQFKWDVGVRDGKPFIEPV